MNKLVSRNPVLRFKLGRKIIKAEKGLWGKLWDRITDTDLAYIDNPAVMTAAGHTSRVSEAHAPTAEERRLGENLTEIGKAGAAAVGGEALLAVRGTLSTGRAVSTVKNTKNASDVRVVSDPDVSVVSLGLRALPGRVSTSNVPATRSSVPATRSSVPATRSSVPATRSSVPATRGNARPNTITVEGRTISSRTLPSKSSTLGRRFVGTAMAAYPLAALMSSDSNSKNEYASGADTGVGTGAGVGANVVSNVFDKNRIAKRHDYKKGLVKYVLDDNGIWYAKWINNPKDPNQGYYRVAEGSTGYDRFGNHNVLRNGKWVKIKENVTPVSTTHVSTTPIDWNQNYNNFKNGLTTALRAYLSKEGVDYDNVESVQKYLLGKLGNNALGKWGVDSKWGGASQAAWDKFAALTDFTPKVDLPSPEQLEKDRQAAINSVLQKPVFEVPQGGLPNFKPLPTNRTYNRAEIRDYIRSKGFGAYDFTGSQRKALRMVMNGQGTDEDRAIVKAMGIFKLGGLLPSRNIIERFKQGKKLIKAQGGLDNTFKLLSDTAERTAEREQYWSDEEARKARAAYDKQMKSSKKSKKKAGRLQTYKGLPIVEIDGLGRGAIENADGSYTWVDVKDFDGQNIQDAMPFESTVKNYPIEIAQVPEVSGIYSSLNPVQTSGVPVIDISKVPSTGKFYNRADVRDYMRRHGVNAYSYTADYRKALRKVLNGQGTESDYDMVRAMGLKLKKGGLLPSRNSIQRFKNRKFN